MTYPDFASAKHYAFTELKHQLSPLLFYHNLAHTCDSVVPASKWLAEQEDVEALDLILLVTAAYYHDIGFIKQRENHEAIGCQIAQRILPHFRYTPDQIHVIQGIIMATKLPQSPKTLLEALVADADLSIFGHKDFFTRNQDLRDELASFGVTMSDRAWYNNQLKFLRNHRYFTPSAQALFAPMKQRNIRELARRMDYGQVEASAIPLAMMPFKVREQPV